MENYCKKCGLCCKAIGITYTKEELEKSGSESALFMLKHWHRITQKTAFKINPHLKKWTNRRNGLKFFRCDCLDEKTNTCLVHDSSPRVCKEFPLYGESKLPANYVFYTDSCGFNRPELKEIQK